MSYYNQPLYGRRRLSKASRYKIGIPNWKMVQQFQKWQPNWKWHKLMKNWNTQIEKWCKPIQKWHKLNWKMVQAIFLPGAWGKIPDFMGKNHPTPLAARAFFYAQNYPFFTRRKNFLKIFKKYIDFYFYMLIIVITNQEKTGWCS